jgi:hypothetical protein
VKDNVSLELLPRFPVEKIQDTVARALPEFVWAMRESDVQGVCLVGTSKAGVNIKMWLREQPVIASVSYYKAWNSEADRESRKMESISDIQQRLLCYFEVKRVVM